MAAGLTPLSDTREISSELRDILELSDAMFRTALALTRFELAQFEVPRLWRMGRGIADARRAAGRDLLVQNAPDNTGISDFGVANLAGFVNIFAGDTKISDFCLLDRGFVFQKAILLWNSFSTLSCRSNFASILRVIVFVRQPPLGTGLDFQSVSLGTVRFCEPFLNALASRIRQR